jgi:hypothetical protein
MRETDRDITLSSTQPGTQTIIETDAHAASNVPELLMIHRDIDGLTNSNLRPLNAGSTAPIGGRRMKAILLVLVTDAPGPGARHIK